MLTSKINNSESETLSAIFKLVTFILDKFYFEKESYKNGQFKENSDESNTFTDKRPTTLLEDLFSSKHFKMKDRDCLCFPVSQTCNQNYSELFSRLATFRHFPSDDNLFVSKLADMGFYYSGPGVSTDKSVTCFTCGVKISEWSNVNDLISRHPPCYNAKNEIIIDNVDNIVDDERGTQISNSECTSLVINTEDDSYIVSVNHDGCLNLIESNISNVLTGDQSEEIQSSTSLPEKDVLLSETEIAQNGVCTIDLDSLVGKTIALGLSPEDKKEMYNVITNYPAKYPSYSSESKRLETFTATTFSLGKHDLAHGGFFCEGDNGITKCFYCGRRLLWKNFHNVKVQHARKSPKCPYIRHIAGQEFVDAVQSLTDENDRRIIDEKMVEKHISNLQKEKKLHQVSVTQRNRVDTPNYGTQGKETINQRNATDLREKYLCRRCRGRLKEVVHLKCNHCCYCFPCLCQLSTIQCPVCLNKKTKGFIVAKLSA